MLPLVLMDALDLDVKEGGGGHGDAGDLLPFQSKEVNALHLEPEVVSLQSSSICAEQPSKHAMSTIHVSLGSCWHMRGAVQVELQELCACLPAKAAMACCVAAQA